MKLLILTTLLVGALAAPMQQSLSVHDDGSYQFFYETGKDAGQHSRSEVRRPDGVVVGKYSYEDANGALREVNYRADDNGYVANGDVSVEGAPKGQFPAPEEEPKDIPAPEPSPVAEDTEPQESTAVESKPEQPEVSHQDNDPKEDDMKDLTLDEPVADDPPEAFPPGFFVQNFHGLRRLPEPTVEEKPTTLASPTGALEPIAPSEQDNEAHPEEQPTSSAEKVEELNKFNEKVGNEMGALMHLRPFQSFAPQPMDTSMFRPPVYVFSYQHPDSYGYHYFF